MSITIETDLKEILDKLDQKMDRQFDKLEQKVDRMQEDITELKLGQTKIEGDIKALDNKGSVIQPIITGITVAFVGGGLLALYKYLP
jgi:phage terminase Nu1 subunit (DNA packaging protein)